MRNVICIGLLVLTYAAGRCQAEDVVRFNRDIRPILSEKCLACHGPDANKRKADLRLDREDAANTSLLAAGKPSASELVKRITSDDPEKRMPPIDSGKELSKEEIELLRLWIEQGAKYEAHWSFTPPQRPTPPTIESAPAVVHEIDQFVRARLLTEGLKPAPVAAQAELIRRVTLDLTGLPPTPQEVEAYLNDQSADAWETVIDRLLQSDRYGEHMARYWLDAARFADTNGYQYDLEREQWVWRDWVIHAFNANMPFDQFTVEQIAGDLLPDATNQQKLATAFHRNHPITIEGGVIDEEYRTEYVVDRVVTTSTVWMGLTMLCCRCHDHKYDPISQREFYQFFAFFNQVPERGLNGFNPKLQVDSPLRAAAVARIDEQLATVQLLLRDATEGIDEDLEKWSQQLSEDVRNQWSVIVPDVRRSEGGADLVVQPDKSILATGKNAAVELYELVMPCDQPVHAIRLEALTHKSFVGGGTGRGSNGNFVLSEFQVAASSDQEGKFENVKIASAEADYSQANYHISQAIDGKIDRTGWAVDGNTKFENRVAVFHLDKPLQPDATDRVRVQLVHRWGGSHHIGRFRISLAPRPIRSVPADVDAIVRISEADRKPEQRSRLTEFLIEQYGSDAQRALVADIKSIRQQHAGLSTVPATMILSEMATPRTTHILLRGEYDKPQQPVSAGTPSLFASMPDDASRNRLGLARWMVMPGHPLTARVAVNRFWQRLFGTGIVKTVEDFGSQGEWPSHPELLDWLAVDFVESGWDMKGLLKQMVMSATYRQSSRLTPEKLQRDPDNRLLSRGPRMRLDAEVIRDSAVFVSGLLTEQLGGASVFPYHPKGLWQEINNRPGYSRTYKQDSGTKLYRRSLYTFWKRTVPPPSMSAFDAPGREFCVVRRSRTNTPLQAFVLLHDPQFVEAARHVGRRMLVEGGDTTDERIRYGFRLCLARHPETAELGILRRVFEERLSQYRADDAAAGRLLAVGESRHAESLNAAELAAWTTLGRTLLNLSEFVTKP